MQISSWLVILKTYNWLLLILACQCRPNLLWAQRLSASSISHRTRLLNTDQVYKDRPTNKPYPPINPQQFDSIYPDPVDSLSYHPSLGSKIFPSQDGNIKKMFTVSGKNPKNMDDVLDEDFDTDNSNRQNIVYKQHHSANDVCVAPDQRLGTCYEASVCAERGGIPMGRCNANGNKPGHVCCLFEVTCSQTIRERHVYFRNPNYPYSYDAARICRAKIHKLDHLSICQLKLTFDQFDIAKPIEGNCTQDSFLISGQNENNIVPRICGYNTGQHYYIGVDESGMVTLHMVFRGNYPRKFDIHIEQIECGSKKQAPAHCLQYYEGTQGTIKSFNYDSDDVSASNRQDMLSVINEGYPNNVDYMICIRKETGFCSISYEFMSDPSGTVLPFSVGLSIPNQFSKRTGLHGASGGLFQTIDEAGRWNNGKLYSTVQTTECDDDYLIVSGMKVCTKIVDATQELDVDTKEHTTSTTTERSLPEDLITPGNISESRAGDLLEQMSPDFHRPNRNGRDENDGDDAGEIEELQRHHRQVELFKDALTRRYRWMMSSPMMMMMLEKESSIQPRLHQQNYVMTTDATPGPFQLRFVSNSVNNAKGFYLAYRQNPCKM